MNDLLELKKDPIFSHFLELCTIPHPSFHEKQISDYLLHWAERHNLSAYQDSHLNVIIQKKAQHTKANAVPILLQAHMDMVCEKAQNVEHNFLTDAIPVQQEGDFLTTGGKTTLGADNGIGIAMALAVLESDSLVHPPLVVVFPPAEEEDLSGAMAVDGTRFDAKKLINLDHAADTQIVCGSCGGMGVKLTLPVQRVDTPVGMDAFSIQILGLPGGHSGEDIHRGHGNSIVLLGRILFACRKFEYLLADISGGNFRLAIPRDSSATILVSHEKCDEFLAAAHEICQIILMEYEGLSVIVSVEPTTVMQPLRVLHKETTHRLLQAIYLSPNGIGEMNHAIEHIVESSNNLGELHLLDDAIQFVYEIRSTSSSTGRYLYQKIEMLGVLLGGTCESFSEYPEWRFDTNSPLRKTAEAVYRAEFGMDAEVLVVHAGLECSCFFPTIPDLDAISIGPNAWNFHSPSERLSISSTQKVYGFLCALLQQLAQE